MPFFRSFLSDSWNTTRSKVLRTTIGWGDSKNQKRECVYESWGDQRVQNFTAFGICIRENTDRRQLERRVCLAECCPSPTPTHSYPAHSSGALSGSSFSFGRQSSLWESVFRSKILSVAREHIACLEMTLSLSSTLVVFSL